MCVNPKDSSCLVANPMFVVFETHCTSYTKVHELGPLGLM
jgi:hypothetical protein